MRYVADAYRPNENLIRLKANVLQSEKYFPIILIIWLRLRIIYWHTGLIKPANSILFAGKSWRFVYTGVLKG